MSLDEISFLIREIKYEIIIPAVFLFISLTITVVNVIYLNQSLHVTSHHMGIRAPLYLRNIIKVGVFVSLLSAGCSLFLILVNMY